MSVDPFPVVCIHEDRTSNLVGVKLAVASLARHAPYFRVVISFPNADANFVTWVATQPNVELAAFKRIRGTGWNIKPSILLEMLERYPEVVWMDSDVIATGDIAKHFTGLAPDVLVASQETYWGQQQGSKMRTSTWGLKPGRTLQCTVNSGILRVTREHVQLLQDWQAMMEHPLYVLAQARPWYERPVHMIGDQEALTGLLGSTNFSHVPVALLQRGKDMLNASARPVSRQASGYLPSWQRVLHLYMRWAPNRGRGLTGRYP